MRPSFARLGFGLLVLAACAARPGWTRVDAVCTAASPPRLCFEADPDQPLELRFEGTTLVPHECADATNAKHGLWVRARLFDGRIPSHPDPPSRHLYIAPGRTTLVTATSQGKLVVDKHPCDGGPRTPDAAPVRALTGDRR